MLKYTITQDIWHSSAQRQYSSGANYDLYIFLRGTAIFRCGAQSWAVDSETMVIFKPGEAGTLVFPGVHGPLEWLRVQLPAALLHELSDEQTDLAAAFEVVPFRQIAVRPDIEIFMLLKNLVRKLTQTPQDIDKFGASVYERGMLQMFVVLVLRACIGAESHKSPINRRHLMLDEVFLYIQTHMDEEITLKQLEEHFFVSYEHISREFKRHTGQTVAEYIRKAKLDRCCKLIEQGYPIVEVYQKAGFGGYNNFFRAFKKQYGMTPKQYYKETRQGARAKE